MAAAENEQAGEIDLADNDKVTNGVYTISSAGDSKFIWRETGNRIVVDERKFLKASINIYLNKVNINTFAYSGTANKS